HNTWLVDIVEPASLERPQPALRDERLMEVVGNVTDRILHDLRNFLLPLASHLELAMASVDHTTEAYRSLLDVRAACGHCQESLSNLAALVKPDEQGERIAHIKDVLDPVVTILRYLMQRRIKIRMNAADGTPPIKMPAYSLQRL